MSKHSTGLGLIERQLRSHDLRLTKLRAWLKRCPGGAEQVRGRGRQVPGRHAGTRGPSSTNATRWNWDNPGPRYSRSRSAATATLSNCSMRLRPTRPWLARRPRIPRTFAEARGIHLPRNMDVQGEGRRGPGDRSGRLRRPGVHGVAHVPVASLSPRGSMMFRSIRISRRGNASIVRSCLILVARGGGPMRAVTLSMVLLGSVLPVAERNCLMLRMTAPLPSTRNSCVTSRWTSPPVRQTSTAGFPAG